MDYPTDEQFEELKRRVERLEQRTEPIKVARIEIDTGEVRERFDRIEQKQADHSERFDILDRRKQELKQELYFPYYSASQNGVFILMSLSLWLVQALVLSSGSCSV